MAVKRSKDGVILVGFSRRRVGKDGKPRWTAYYIDLKGRERSAGTYATKGEAKVQWQDAESKIRQGRLGDPKRGRMKFERYVEDTWLPNHVMEPKTRENYTYAIYKHIMDEFGPMRMIDILPEHVREWITKQQEKGVTPATISHNKTILSAIFTTAFDDQVTFLHPCKGVKTPTVPIKPRTIITPADFDKLYQALPDADTQLLVETSIESGLRWGELTELRVNDLDFQSRILTVSRAVVEIMNPKHRPNGERFVVKEYPKDKEYRRFKLSTQIVEKLKTHKDSENLDQDDLLFAIRHQVTTTRKLRAVPNPDELGLTEPNEHGRQYKHGTLSGYGAGKCRCDHCRAAVTIYRAARRAKGKDNPRQPRLIDTDGHIPNNHFRNTVWNKAAVKAGLSKAVENTESNNTGKKARQKVVGIRIHDLRHAHASWLLAGGADIQVVKERLGHGSLNTTERYLHTLPEADETALDALSNIRQRARQ